MTTQQALSRYQVENIVSHVDLGTILYDRPKFTVVENGDGYLLQFSYYEADATNPSGGPVLQKCRKWYISPYSTITEVVRTAYKAVEASMAHRLGEHFRYQGVQIHNPRRSVFSLVNAAGEVDARIPKQET